jgi:hypothetical protein
METAINDISGFLGRYAPQRLDALRSRFPDQAARFEPEGLTMGAGDADALRAAASAMLEEVGEVADRAEAAVMQRLRVSRVLELVGALVSLLSSAGVITAIWGLESPAAALPIAMVGFVGGAVPLVVNWLRSDAAGAGSAAEALVKLRDAVWNARALKARLGREPAGEAVVAEANALARDISRLLADLGYRSAARPV